MMVFRSILFACLIALGSGFTAPDVMLAQYASDSDGECHTDNLGSKVESEYSEPTECPLLPNCCTTPKIEFSGVTGDVCSIQVIYAHRAHHRGATKEPPATPHT